MHPSGKKFDNYRFRRSFARRTARPVVLRRVRSASCLGVRRPGASAAPAALPRTAPPSRRGRPRRTGASARRAGAADAGAADSGDSRTRARPRCRKRRAEIALMMPTACPRSTNSHKVKPGASTVGTRGGRRPRRRRRSRRGTASRGARPPPARRPGPPGRHGRVRPDGARGQDDHRREGCQTLGLDPFARPDCGGNGDVQFTRDQHRLHVLGVARIEVDMDHRKGAAQPVDGILGEPHGDRRDRPDRHPAATADIPRGQFEPLQRLQNPAAGRVDQARLGVGVSRRAPARSNSLAPTAFPGRRSSG